MDEVPVNRFLEPGSPLPSETRFQDPGARVYITNNISHDRPNQPTRQLSAANINLKQQLMAVNTEFKASSLRPRSAIQELNRAAWSMVQVHGCMLESGLYGTLEGW